MFLYAGQESGNSFGHVALNVNPPPPNLFAGWARIFSIGQYESGSSFFSSSSSSVSLSTRLSSTLGKTFGYGSPQPHLHLNNPPILTSTSSKTHLRSCLNKS